MTKNRAPTPVYLDPGMHPGLEVKGLTVFYSPPGLRGSGNAAETAIGVFRLHTSNADLRGGGGNPVGYDEEISRDIWRCDCQLHTYTVYIVLVHQKTLDADPMLGQRPALAGHERAVVI